MDPWTTLLAGVNNAARAQPAPPLPLTDLKETDEFGNVIAAAALSVPIVGAVKWLVNIQTNAKGNYFWNEYCSLVDDNKAEELKVNVKLWHRARILLYWSLILACPNAPSATVKQVVMTALLASQPDIIRNGYDTIRSEDIWPPVSQ